MEEALLLSGHGAGIVVVLLAVVVGPPTSHRRCRQQRWRTS